MKRTIFALTMLMALAIASCSDPLIKGNFTDQEKWVKNGNGYYIINQVLAARSDGKFIEIKWTTSMDKPYARNLNQIEEAIEKCLKHTRDGLFSDAILITPKAGNFSEQNDGNFVCTVGITFKDAEGNNYSGHVNYDYDYMYNHLDMSDYYVYSKNNIHN